MATEELGIRCPKCWCKHHSVTSTERIRGRIRRRRTCRNCGNRFVTTEKISTNGESAPQLDLTT
jgi:transcriptional regulator NrdR family protein